MDDPASIEYMARYIADQQQKYTQKGGVRPFGLCLLVIGFDKFKSPRLFLTEPSGIHSEWQVCFLPQNISNIDVNILIIAQFLIDIAIYYRGYYEFPCVGQFHRTQLKRCEGIP